MKAKPLNVFVALLRGVNVGGNNMISMKELKESFEGVGVCRVTTYIGSYGCYNPRIYESTV